MLMMVLDIALAMIFISVLFGLYWTAGYFAARFCLKYRTVQSLRIVQYALNHMRRISMVVVALSGLAILASCGYIIWEHNYGDSGPDSMRGLDYPIMAAMVFVYGAGIVIPHVYAIKKDKPVLGLFGILTHLAIFVLVVIGFISLLF